MNDVEKLIAKLIDEHKITGEEAVILINSTRHGYVQPLEDQIKKIDS